jgi:hypothetical protein
MYFLDSTTMVQLALERQRDLTKQAENLATARATYGSAPKRNRRALQHSAGAALVRLGRHLQA